MSVCLVPGAGVKLCDVYSVAMEMVEQERPDLKDHFTRNAGYELSPASFS